jgi:hypothetical protein
MESMRDEQLTHQGALTPDPTAVTPSSAAQNAGMTADGIPRTGSDEGHSLTASAQSVAEKLKPVAEAAETLASVAVSLSARGLNWLDSTLAERREHRKANGGSTPSETPATTDTAAGGETKS